MNAEIIAVGTELLLGQIANTNAQFLSQELAKIGVNVYFHTVCGDNPKRLEDVLKIANNRSDCIIITGGLGPTKDDLTKETVAKHLGKQLVLDENTLASIQSYFEKSGRIMTDNNKKQAYILEGSQILPNDHGTAPGIFIKHESKCYMLLPGPPRELQPMFLTYGRQVLLAEMDIKEKIHSRVLRYFGIGESQLEKEIEDIIDSQSNPTVAPLAGDQEVTIRITARHSSDSVATQMIDEVEEKINNRVGQYFYGYDETTLMETLLKELISRKLTIAVAESLTGGLFQKEMTALSGASSALVGGVVCYSTKAKMKLCQVKKETIETYGVVSKECAIELANNIRAIHESDIGISFTGVAGPDSLEGKNPGTVWMAISMLNQPTKVYLLNLSGTRIGIQKRAVNTGCFYLLNELKKL